MVPGVAGSAGVGRELIAHDGFAVLGNHDIDAFSAGELVGQHFATEQTWLPSDQAGSFALAAGGQASRHAVFAASTRVLNAPSHRHRWGWRAAHWLAAGITGAHDTRLPHQSQSAKCEHAQSHNAFHH